MSKQDHKLFEEAANETLHINQIFLQYWNEKKKNMWRK